MLRDVGYVLLVGIYLLVSLSVMHTHSCLACSGSQLFAPDHHLNPCAQLGKGSDQGRTAAVLFQLNDPILCSDMELHVGILGPFHLHLGQQRLLHSLHLVVGTPQPQWVVMAQVGRSHLGAQGAWGK